LEETRSKTNLDVLRAEYATALGKKGSLEAVIAEHGYSTESVRRLFQSGVMNGGLAPVGVLADFLEVEPRYERVVEDFLRDELNYVVVKSWDAADEGLRCCAPAWMAARPSSFIRKTRKPSFLLCSMRPRTARRPPLKSSR
jgi:chromosome segregation protein